MDYFDIYPWQKPLWQLCLKIFKQLPHAILFSGMKGVGKSQIAKAFIGFIMCENKKEVNACRKCKSCLLYSTEKHPDFYLIKPEKKDGNIKVDQIRQAINELNQTPLLSGYRVVLIQLAENMNHASQNALLKTLEEPGKNTLIVLLSERPALLSATILSRVQKINCIGPSVNDARVWLHENQQMEKQIDNKTLLTLTNNSPLLSLAYAQEGFLTWHNEFQMGIVNLISLNQSVSRVIENLKHEHVTQYVLLCLTHWTKAIIHYKLGIVEDRLLYTNYVAQIKSQCDELSLVKIFIFHTYLQEKWRQHILKIALNEQLFLEDLFIHVLILFGER